jgi:dipeptidase E
MRLLLTSAGISNLSINDALVGMLGKPIADASALVIPTAIYPFSTGPHNAAQMIRGLASNPLCELGWKSLGVLELTALPSIRQEVWVSLVQETDALLVWGGDPVYLSHWMRESGLGRLLPALRPEAVYVGVSAGAIATSILFGETYRDPPGASGATLSSEDLVYETPDGPASTRFVTAHGVGLVDFALIPHVDFDDQSDLALVESWTAKVPVPTYAIDDQTAIAVTDGTTEVVSEGRWTLFNA